MKKIVAFFFVSFFSGYSISSALWSLSSPDSSGPRFSAMLTMSVLCAGAFWWNIWKIVLPEVKKHQEIERLLKRKGQLSLKVTLTEEERWELDQVKERLHQVSLGDLQSRGSLRK